MATPTLTTPAVTGPAEPPLQVPRRESIRTALIPFAALCLAFFVEMVDNTIITIALPTLGRDLHATTTQLQWVTGAYSLVFGALLLTAGSVADRFGRRRVLMSALALFGVLSSLVWFVTDANQFIALRAALGVAAAGMAPVTMSLVFRLFDDELVRMRAIGILVVVGMTAMALGPLLAGSALAAVSWHWLIFVNTPIALLAALGVRFGIARDEAAELHPAPLDVPAAVLTMATMALGCYSLTSGVERGWTATLTLACFAGAALALVALIVRERTTTHPMLDLGLFRNRTVRGAALAQLGTSIAMMTMMFLLILHFQYALGWSPLRAGLGNLPFVLTMMFGGQLAERVTAALGHRLACLLGTVLICAALVGFALAVPRGYLWLAVAMVVLTLGLRIIMTVGAVALIQAMPEDRTSLGSALNDASQEIGTSLGTAVVGTILAALVGSVLPSGAWTAGFTSTFFHAEQVIYLVVAVLVAVVAGYGCSTLTNSHEVDEH